MAGRSVALPVWGANPHGCYVGNLPLEISLKRGEFGTCQGALVHQDSRGGILVAVIHLSPWQASNSVTLVNGLGSSASWHVQKLNIVLVVAVYTLRDESIKGRLTGLASTARF